MTSFVVEKYKYFMNDAADPRVKHWLGFSNPLLPLVIVTMYLFTVYLLAPAYMKNRKPYKLKKFLYFYNIFQIVYCSLLIYYVATSGWFTHYSWKCQPVDYSNNRDAIRMLQCCYYTYILKGIELIETIIFILRKKYNQVSKLHVYHHSSTFLLGWIGVKYIGGGMATFPIMINSMIHILMYTYYLLSSFGPKWQKRLMKWKPKLTMLQMIQFCILIAQSLLVLNPNCKVQKQILLFYLPNVLLIFRMFYNFYRKNYIKKIK